jgi:hypothetical protein
MRQEADGRWVAEAPRVGVQVSGPTRQQCLGRLRRAVGGEGDRQVVLVVEVVPRLAGVAEAAQVMGWDKRRVITYLTRGRFPPPLQSLASGRVWRRSDVEEFARAWRARRAARGARSRPRGAPDPRQGASEEGPGPVSPGAGG